MKFYINGNRISRNNLKEMIGSSRLNQIAKEASEMYLQDNNICIQYMVSGGILTVEF